MCGILREVEAEGIEKGRIESKVEIIKRLMHDKKCSLDEAMDIVYIPTDEREKYTKLILG